MNRTLIGALAEHLNTEYSEYGQSEVSYIIRDFLELLDDGVIKVLEDEMDIVI